MWKNWNPFRRKQKDDHDGNENKNEDLSQGKGGKENTASSLPAETVRARSNDNNLFQANHSFSDMDDGGTNPTRKPNVSRSRQESLRSRTRMGFKDQLNTTLPTPQYRHITRCPDDNSMNNTFSGVHGPLLSSPIVPQVRKALESQVGIGSPRILSKQGKPVGRSASLNYGMSRSMNRTTAGQVPWVRLKRRESIGLSDLVAGKTPQSPNTVKLAAPEPRHLPAPPSFKTTPVIVTTEPSRSRVIDTQTVVSALREKRKRFGGSQQDELTSEDSWQNSAKRRRQDSSQSNASSVSIPPMPDSLPDLMGTSGTSLLHIENLSSQRPSTVPAAVDPYTSAPVMTSKPASSVSSFGGFGSLGGSHVIGLGGADSNTVNPVGLTSQNLPFYRYPTYPQPQQQQQQNSSLQQRQAQYMAGGSGGNINNSKTVLRSIQSSLSSSLRTRVNSATLRQHGIDLKRIRGSTQDNVRRLSFSSDTSLGAGSAPEEPVQKISKQSASRDADTESQEQPVQKINLKQISEKPEEQKEVNVSTPTKLKIAEGVMLRKQNMSITPTASPARPLRALPASSLVSADDFESDRQQEYQRRVLDMLASEEGETEFTGTVQTSTTSAGATLLTLTSPSTRVSQASTNTINASLASLSKLVQSTTPGMSATVASTTASAVVVGVTKPSSSLKQLLSADEPENVKTSGANGGLTLAGNPLTSLASDQKNASAPSISTSNSVPAAALSIPTTSVPVSAGLPEAGSTSGFQVNFGTAFSAASKPSLPSGFSFGVTPATASITTPVTSSTTIPASLNVGSIAGSVSKPQDTPAVAVTAPPAQPQQNQIVGDSATSKLVNLPTGGGTSLSQVAQTVATSSTSAGFSFSPAPPAVVTSASTSAPGEFNLGTGVIGNATSTSIVTSAPTVLPKSGFNFGAISSPATSTTTTTNTITGAPNSGFTFGSVPTSTVAATSSLGMFSGVNKPAPTVSSFSGFAAVPPAQTSLNPLTATTSGFGTAASTKPDQQPPSTSGLSSSSTMNLAPAFGSTASFGTSVGGNMPKTTASLSGFHAVPPAFNFSGSSNATPQTGSKLFTFGASAAPATAAPAQGAPTPSSFGVGAPPGLVVFGGASTAASTTPLSGFGATTASETSFRGTVTTASLFGSTASGFGASSVSATAVPAFGAGSTSAFGAATTSAPGFGAGAFAFGGAQTTTTAAGKTGFGTTFGGTSSFSTGAAPSFGSSTAVNFGAPAKPSLFGAAGNAGSNVSSPSQPGAFGISSGVAPGFGNTPSQNTQTATPFVFGAGTQAQQPGGSNQPFVFGSTPATSSQVSGFGSTSGAAPSSTTLFGQSAASSMFGSGANNNKPAFGAAGAAPVFGATNRPASASTPAFGSGLASPPSFGSSGQQPKPAPAFGATGFGSGIGQGSAFGAQPPNSTMSSSGVTSPFGKSNVFGKPAKQNPFGAGVSAPGQSAPVFNFSGNQQPQASTAFGAQSAAAGSVPPAFNFGAQATSGGAQSQTGAFNFTARPSFPTPGPAAGGFNFAAAAGSTPTFNFNAGGTPQPGSTTRPRVAATKRVGNRRINRR